MLEMSLMRIMRKKILVVEDNTELLKLLQGQFMMELEFRGIRPAASLPMRQLGSEVFTSPASDPERLVQGG
jgi:hypothetical protein